MATCTICQKVDATTAFSVKLQKNDEKISIDVPVCKECKGDFKLLSQMLMLFAVFITMVFSTIMLFMAWGYQHTGETTTSVLFALSPILIGFLSFTWAKNMIRKSHFTVNCKTYPDVAAKIKEGFI